MTRGERGDRLLEPARGVGTMESMFTVTEPAQQKIRELLAAENISGLGLRVEVRPGGCSGFRYEMSFDSEMLPGDSTVNFDGFDVRLDEASGPLLEGASLDYRDGLDGAGFKIENPQARRTCGCGQSFS